MKKDIFDKLREISVNNHRAEELIKSYKDRIYFLKKYAKIQHPCKGAVPFTAYVHQIELLRAFNENKSNIVLGARQVGISTTAAMYIFSYAFFESDKLIAVIGDKLMGAKEILYRIRFAYENLPDWLKEGNKLIVKNKNCLEFENGTKIITASLDPWSLQGISPSLVFLDNFAQVSRRKQEEFYTRLVPHVLDALLIISSTLSGPAGLFGEIWHSAVLNKNRFVPHHIKWDSVVGRDDEFKNQTINMIGESRWNKEFECSFND